MHHCAFVTLNEPWALSTAGRIAEVVQGGASKCNSLLTCVTHVWVRQQLLKGELVMSLHEDFVSTSAMNQEMTATISN